MLTEGNSGASLVHCDACGTDRGPFLKLSLGKDFFGRAYDRLSPATDQSPKWYCKPCSMQKNLQRDFRDIRTEFDKLIAGQPSEIASGDKLQRAQVRLTEIVALLDGSASGARMVDPGEVKTLIQRLQAHSGSSPVTG